MNGIIETVAATAAAPGGIAALTSVADADDKTAATTKIAPADTKVWISVAERTKATSRLPDQALPLIERGEREAAAMAQADSAGLSAKMNFGDILIELRPLVPHGMWREFPFKQFGVSKSDAHDAIKLAKARPTVEAAMSRCSGRLSTHQALKLLRKPRQSRKKIKKPKINTVDEMVAAWSWLDDENRRLLFASIPFEEARKAFPTEYFTKLSAYFIEQLVRVETIGKSTIDGKNPPAPIVRARKLLRVAMSTASENEALGMVKAAGEIVITSHILIDDLLYVPDPVNAGMRSARRRAA